MENKDKAEWILDSIINSQNPATKEKAIEAMVLFAECEKKDQYNKVMDAFNRFFPAGIMTSNDWNCAYNKFECFLNELNAPI